jgi:uncharacterized Zn finger protein (UPF0148 family)
MAKKEKQVCPYCGKEFVYLSRHKCKVKERMESKEDESTQKEIRQERVKERKRELTRKLNKDEQEVLDIINKERDLVFEDLREMVDIERNKLDEIIDLLELQSRIKVRRELISASWSKHIFSIEELEEDLKVEEIEVDKSKPDWLWREFLKQPCFICPFIEQCSDDNPDIYNPNHCPWLTEWIELSINGEEYTANFDAYKEEYFEEEE